MRGFFAATGRPPFEAESAHKLLIQHLTVAAPAITSIRSNFPEKLGGVVARSLEKEPAKRFATGEAMADAIGALHLRGREIAPLLRLFHQQTAQSLQSLLMLVIVYAIFFQVAPSARTLLGAMIAVLFASVALTVVTQTLDRVRFAVRRGFTVEDVRSAFETIADETVRGRDQLLGDRVERARINRRKRIAMAGGFVGGMTIPIVLRIVNLAPEGRKGVGTTGGLLLLGGTVLIGVSIGLWNMRPVRITLAQRAAHRIWGSRLGRALFARAQRRYARELERVAARASAR